MAKIIIESDEGFKAFKPRELPDGCVVSFIPKDSTYRVKEYDLCSPPTKALIRVGTYLDVKLHDIVDESGNSTHVKRWMTKDEENEVIVLDRPDVESGGNSIDIYAPFLSHDVVTEVWEKI